MTLNVYLGPLSLYKSSSISFFTFISVHLYLYISVLINNRNKKICVEQQEHYIIDYFSQKFIFLDCRN